MAYKSRTKPTELSILEALDKRTHLETSDKQRYSNLQKGYEGEVIFDTLTRQLKCECLILNDLLLTQNHTTFQLDTLLVAHGKIHLFEIKNNEGDYYYEADHVYHESGVKLNHPVHQLARSESLLQQLVYALGHKLLIESAVVYINPAFTLYQSPRGQPIIYPTQIKAHLNRLNQTTSRITDRHKKLADQLVQRHQTDSRFQRVPEYDYENMRKGIWCRECGSFLKVTQKKLLVCRKCGHAEEFLTLVLRSIQEFKLLFPNKKITTQKICEWCGLTNHKRVKGILLTHFKRMNIGRWTYFES